MATCLFHQNGRMECWNVGILGIKAEVRHYNCKKLLQTHYSITPLFHYSNWACPLVPRSGRRGEAPKF
jgi:hypothetical protein